MKRTPLKRYTPLKAKTPLKTKTPLRSGSSLKTKTPLRTSHVTTRRKTVSHKDLKKCGFSILTDNMYTCYISKRTDDIHVHHIFGAANKSHSETYGFIVPLTGEWHNLSDHGVHFNKELDLKLKRLCENYWLEHYGTKEDFINIFGKWW